jgi:hypothetical protein
MQGKREEGRGKRRKRPKRKKAGKRWEGLSRIEI